MIKRGSSADHPDFVDVSFLGCCLLLGFTCTGWAQEQPDMKISTETKSQVIAEVLQQLGSKYVFPQVAEQMEKAIRSP